MKPATGPGRAAAILVLFAAALPAFVGGTQAGELRAAEGIAVIYPEAITEEQARTFAERVAEERRRVRAWWGTTFEDAIRLRITDEVPITMALVPAWRGQRGTMEVPVALVQRDSAASLHEIVHIYATNGNRFLAEGLAVYAHDLLGGGAAFPNFGRNLHELAQRVAPDHSIVELERFATPRPIGGREAYIAAGSFVGFLIDRYGMELFRRLYELTPLTSYRREAGDPARWQKLYGKPLESLEREWRAFLAGGGR